MRRTQEWSASCAMRTGGDSKSDTDRKKPGSHMVDGAGLAGVLTWLSGPTTRQMGPPYSVVYCSTPLKQQSSWRDLPE